MHDFLKGGEILSAGARTIAAGGFQSMPKLEMPGAVLVGDSAGTLNVPKIKGIHQAIRCGIAAADYFAENNTSIGFDAIWRKTEAVAELQEVRNIKPGFKAGLKLGVLNAGIESMLGGKTPWTLRNHATFPLEKLAEYESPNRHWVNRDLPPRDRLSSVFFAVTAHDEVQPVHLHVRDRNICATTCATEYGNPCTRFCPALGIRDGRRRRRRQEAADQCGELRALQSLRHQGPVPDHRMGDAGRRLRPQLPAAVTEATDVLGARTPREIAKRGFTKDSAQLAAVRHLERLRAELAEAASAPLGRRLLRGSRATPRPRRKACTCGVASVAAKPG